MKNELLPYLNLSLQDIEGEEWEDIEDFEGYYQVSNMGRVKSLERTVLSRNINGEFFKTLKEKIKKQFVIKKDLTLGLCSNNNKYSFRASHLVANAFLEKKKKEEYIIAYKNNKHTDLRPENLYWCNSDLVSRNIINYRKKFILKTSKYNGVSAPFIMNICINRKIIREVFETELEAAKKYDYYVKKYKLNRELNFPDE